MSKASNDNDSTTTSTTSTTMDLPEPTIQEEFRRLKVVRCGGKVRHVDVSVVNDFGVVSVLTANNQVSLGFRGTENSTCCFVLSG